MHLKVSSAKWRQFCLESKRNKTKQSVSTMPNSWQQLYLVPGHQRALIWLQSKALNPFQNFLLSMILMYSYWSHVITLINTWWHRSASTLALVMAWCQTAQSHYLNQYWVIITKIQWHPTDDSFTRDPPVANHWNEFENYLYKPSFKSPWGQWVNSCEILWHLAALRKLTHLPRNKMADISQTTFSDAFSVNAKFCILIEISLKFVPKGLIYNQWALVQVMVWCRTGDKQSVSEPMLNQFTDVYLRHYGELS